MVRLGHDVLAIDKHAGLVQEFSSRLTRVVQADTASRDALEQLGCGEFGVAVVGIGTSIESSVLTCSNLVDLGIAQVWAKAISPAHGTILTRIGIQRVVFPESDAGKRVAHLVSGKLVDFMEFDDGFAIAKLHPPKETQGFTLAQSQVRQKYGVTVVGVKPPHADFVHAVPDTKISEHDVMIVSGRADLIERFAARP